jgi:hypothetical protein
MTKNIDKFLSWPARAIAAAALIFSSAGQANLMQTSLDFTQGQGNAGFSLLRATFTYDDDRQTVVQSSGAYRDIFGPNEQGWSGARTDYNFATFKLTGVQAIDARTGALLTPLNISDAVASLLITSVTASRSAGSNSQTRSGQFVDIAFSFLNQLPASGISSVALRFYSPVQDFDGNLIAGPTNLVGFGDATRFRLATENFAPTNADANDCCELRAFAVSTPVVSIGQTPIKPSPNPPPVPAPVPVPLPASAALVLIGLVGIKGLRVAKAKLLGV